ncbi:MAG: GldG family protein [Chloroflexi bacterium]|nr:GldG family protein [Chloroflexota bacterium]
MSWNERLERLTPAAGVTGAALLLVAVGWWLVTRTFAGPVQVITALGAALVVYWAAGSLSTLRQLLGRRATRYGTSTVVAVVAFFVLLGLANFLATRYSTRWDLTRTGQYTLSPQTLQVLQQLKEPVKITAFYTVTDPRRTDTEDLMKEYLVRTDKLSIEYIDPEAQPALARQLGIRTGGTLVFESGGRRTEITSVTEANVTGALLKVMSGEQKKVYFTNANGELELTSSDRTGLSLAKQQLERLNYLVEPLNLLTTPTVPSDAAVVVVAGPRRPFSEAARQALQRYLDNGGKMLILVDPRTPHGLEPLLQTFGLQVGDGFIIDPASSLPQDIGALVIQRYQFSAITRDLAPTVFPLATAILRTDNPPQDLTIFPIAESSPQSWLERNPERIQFDEGVDQRGPLPVAQQVERRRSGDTPQHRELLRLVVVGDSDFASNQFFNLSSNGDFFLNSVNWLAESEALIAIPPKTPDQETRLVLTPVQTNLILFSSVLFLPLVVLGAGAAVWWQRR